MNKEILFLRISYWVASLADFSIAVSVLIPERMGLTEIVYPMSLISATTFSWGILLLVADRKPLERRWVLIPTIIVVALLSAARIIFTLNGKVKFSIALLVFGAGLIFFMAYSYYYANKTEKIRARITNNSS